MIGYDTELLDMVSEHLRLFDAALVGQTNIRSVQNVYSFETLPFDSLPEWRAIRNSRSDVVASA
jgi:hypothetical protein